jgi:hypothetical protein
MVEQKKIRLCTDDPIREAVRVLLDYSQPVRPASGQAELAWRATVSFGGIVRPALLPLWRRSRRRKPELLIPSTRVHS